MTTKRTIQLAVLVAALAFCGGVLAYGHRSAAWFIQAALAIAFAGNLAFSLWLWRRAPPDSGDAMVLPTTTMASASMLCGLLPRVLWPEVGYAHVAGWAVGLFLATLMWIRRILDRRRSSGRKAV